MTTKPFHYRHFLHGLYVATVEEGFPSLFKGAGARMLFHAPSVAISISLYERLKLFWEKVLRMED